MKKTAKKIDKRTKECKSLKAKINTMRTVPAFENAIPQLTKADTSSPAMGPRITPDDIKFKIAHTHYMTQGVLTVCLVTMINGFTVVGKAAPVSALNFDVQRGRDLAYEDAFRQLWALEGYLLRERIMHGEI